MNIMTVKTITTLSAAAALTLGLGACSHHDRGRAGDSSSATGATAGSAPSAGGPAGAESGSYSASIDGEPYTVDNPIITCDKDGDAMVLDVSSLYPGGAGDIMVVIDDGSVSLVTMGATSGRGIRYLDGGPGSVSATVSGSTYTITGEARYVDLDDPTASGSKPFDVTITCP